MAKSSGKGKRQSSASKIQALQRAQHINELLKRGAIESEALQSGGDDRPIGEQHISDLLESNRAERTTSISSGKRSRPKKASKAKKKRR